MGDNLAEGAADSIPTRGKAKGRPMGLPESRNMDVREPTRPPNEWRPQTWIFEVVGRERFELSTYGLRVRVTRISMRPKPKIPNEFFVALPIPRPKPNLSRTAFR